MTISVFARRGEDTALEIHRHEATTLAGWLSEHVRGFSEEKGLISVDINGVTVTDFSCRISAGDDVRIYPVAGTVMQALQLGLMMFSVVYALTRKTPSSEYETGTALAVASTRAVNTRPGEVIRETLGCCRSYPDYIVQQTMRFTAPDRYYVYMFVSLGTGDYAYDEGEILVGDTPVTSFDADYKFYAANALVDGDERTENWYNCPNVGATTSASGLDLDSTSPSTEYVGGESVTVSSQTITLNGGNQALTAMISPGTLLTIRVPFNVYVARTSDSAYPVAVWGEGFDRELNFSLWDAATLVIDDVTYDVYVSRIWNGITDSDGKTWPVGYSFSSTKGVNTAWTGAGAGLAPGNARLIVEATGVQYYASSVSSSSVRVTQYTGGVVSNWNGFYPRTQTDYDVSYVNDNNLWLGPFVASPEGEETDALEVNFTFPGGLIRYNSKGKKKSAGVTVVLRYSLDGGGSWKEKTFSYSGKTVDGIGYTERITFSAAKHVQVMCRRTSEAGEDGAQDTCYWQALRTRLTRRPSQYGIQTMALTLRSGGMLAADSERQLSLKLTRNYTRGAKGSISGAIYCVLSSLNIPENMIDYDTIDALESSVWTPGGYTFNSTITGADSVWNMLTTILQAAGSYPLLKNGMFSAGYTGIKAPVCAFTPQDYAGDGLTVTYQAPSRDDYNAVDVTWTDDNLTAGVVECRGSHSYNADEQKTESWTLTGVTDRNIAWPLGMRRLLSYQYQRMIFSFSTEMLALNCSYGDVVWLFDEVVDGYYTSRSALILDHRSLDDGTTYLLLSEPLNGSWQAYWSDTTTYTVGNSTEADRILIRYPDGTVSGLMALVPNDGGTVPEGWRNMAYVIRLKTEDTFSLLARQNASEEPARVVQMRTEKAGYKAIIQSVEPQSDGTVSVTAVVYDERVYRNDGKDAP
ncbi:hypothetical protein ACAY63_001847 [Escherichia coli]